MIQRALYLNRIMPFVDKPIIKAVTGIRRCGKSTFLKLLMQEFRSRGVPDTHILYINKDSLAFDFLANYRDLHRYVTDFFARKKGRKYLLIDEVQEMVDWEKAVAGFFTDEVADIYLTGSNAGLLSSDLTVNLTGRYIEFRMHTLTFHEFLTFREKPLEKSREEFTLYLKYGGFPGIHQMVFEEEVIVQYISAIYSTVLFKDVVSKHQIRDVPLLERIARYLADNCGNITTARGISHYIKSQHLNCSADTVQNYMQWLVNAFLMHRVPRFDIKGKRQLELYDKYYMADTGFIRTLFGDKMQDISGKLENVVFHELVSRGYSVNVGKLADREIDFIAEKGSGRVYLQVAYLLATEEVIEREFGALEGIPDNYPKMVLSMDEYFGRERNGIQWMNLIDFLLKPETGV
jgi:uncharacterized protein